MFDVKSNEIPITEDNGHIDRGPADKANDVIPDDRPREDGPGGEETDCRD